jgi:uncharacterized protein (DUF488 family)
MTIYTIGHSTHSAEAFTEMLVRNGVQQVVDVRRFPGSRRWPHFNQDAMREWLAAARIEYRHEPDLGGRRKGSADSPNTFWENAAFRAFADYMATPEFEAALERLIEAARERPTAIMCSEAVPWRCHRRLIADALLARGIEVLDIVGSSRRVHELNPHARIDADHRLTYV